MNINQEELDIYIPSIDDRSEEFIYQRASDVISAESGGELNDFSDNSPAGVLLRAQSFTFAELLFKVNKLLLALLLSFLKRTGTTRQLGAKSLVPLTFELTAGRPVPFTIPANFEVRDSSGKFSYYTQAPLIIPVGSIAGTISAIAAVEGEEYNLPRYRISSSTQPLTFLAKVTNLEPAQGGVKAEAVEAAINRGILKLRQRNLVSKDDFKNAAEEVLGADSRAVAIGLLGSDKITRQLGAVHLFCASAQDEPSNFAALQAVRMSIESKLMMGTSLYVSPMDFVPIRGNIVVKANTSADIEVLTDNLWKQYRDYLSLKKFIPGDVVRIDELRYRMRQAVGIRYLDYILLNEAGLDISMPNDFSCPSAYNLIMTIVDSNGVSYTRARGILDEI